MSPSNPSSGWLSRDFVEPSSLRTALTLGGEAAGDALSYAWEHWENVRGLKNPLGYLYRVGQSSTRRRKTPIVFARPDGHDLGSSPSSRSRSRSCPSVNGSRSSLSMAMGGGPPRWPKSLACESRRSKHTQPADSHDSAMHWRC